MECADNHKTDDRCDHASCNVRLADHPAAGDRVRDGVTGLWFKGGDAEDLAMKIRQLMDPTAARRLGRAAYYSYWSNPSTVDHHVEALGEVYKKMLKT